MTMENDFKPYGKSKNGIYSWQDIRQWTLGHEPTAIEDIVTDATDAIGLQSQADVNIHSLSLENNNLIVSGGSDFILGRGKSTISRQIAVLSGDLINHGTTTITHAGSIIDTNGTVINGSDGVFDFTEADATLSSIENNGIFIFTTGSIG